MAESTSTQVVQEQVKPNPDLQSLDRMVGTWKLSGGTEGICSYEWFEGGFFLAQHVDLEQNGQKIKGLEIIGHTHPFGEEPSKDIRSRFYSFLDGMTLDYVYELQGNTLTIWAGERGSPAYYEGHISDDGNTVTGEWFIPEGAGYKSVATRIKRDLVVSRIVDAPVERVWNAWTDSQQMKRWWGPQGFTAPIADMDVREGGTSFVCMRSPDGQDFCNNLTYQKIVPMQSIEFIDNLVDRNGNKIDPTEIGLPPEFPESMRTVVTFRPKDTNQTELTVTEYGWASDRMYNLSKAGLEESLDKLEASLKQ